MSVMSGRAKLKEAAKELFARWNQTRSIWRDEVAQQFEEDVLDPLVTHLRGAESAMDHMETVMNQLRRDCE